MNQFNNLIVYNKKLAAQLIKEGFKCLDYTTNKNNPKLLVWYFENTHDTSLRIAELAEQIRSSK